MEWIHGLELASKILMGLSGALIPLIVYLTLPRCPQCGKRMQRVEPQQLGLAPRQAQVKEYFKQRPIFYCRKCDAFWYDPRKVLGISTQMLLPLEPGELAQLGPLDLKRMRSTPAGRALAQWLAQHQASYQASLKR